MLSDGLPQGEHQTGLAENVAEFIVRGVWRRGVNNISLFDADYCYQVA